MKTDQKVLLQAVQQTISSEPRKNCWCNNVKVHGDTADNYEKYFWGQ